MCQITPPNYLVPNNLIPFTMSTIGTTLAPGRYLEYPDYCQFRKVRYPLFNAEPLKPLNKTK